MPAPKNVKTSAPKIAKVAKKAVKKATRKVAKKVMTKTAAKTGAAKKTVKKTVKKVVKKVAAKKSAPVKPVVKAAPAKTTQTALKGAAVKKVIPKAVKKAAGVKKSAAKKPARAPVSRPSVAPAPRAVEPVRITVSAGDAGSRIDRYLGEKLDNASRTRIQKWMHDGAVHINGEPARKSRVLEPGDVVVVTRPTEVAGGRAEPENIPLDIVYEDKYLVVVNKPKGLVTHPGHGVPGGTLANALLYHYKKLSDFGGTDRPGIVHRLDRDTSGLLVAARDNVTHAALSTMLAERTIHRTYQALVWREAPPAGTFDAPLGRHPRDPVKRAVITPTYRGVPGKTAVTHYKVLDWFQFASHVEVTLETGRTHQIRVHFTHAGHPVAGDTLYGGGEPMLGRVPPLFQAPAAGLLKRLSSQALHAVRLSFTHPRTKKKLSFESPLPEEFRESLKFLEKFKREVEEEDVIREDLLRD